MPPILADAVGMLCFAALAVILVACGTLWVYFRGVRKGWWGKLRP